MATPTTKYDPQIPVYAEPEEVKEYSNVTAAPNKTVANYLNPRTGTVEGRIQGIMANNSLLRNAVEGDARVASNQRGILNTTMGTQAGTKALLDKSVEIATPDAQTYADFGKLSKQYDMDTGLADQAGEIEHGLTRTKGHISGALTEQELGGQAELTKQDIAGQRSLQAQDYYHRRNLLREEFAGKEGLQEIIDTAHMERINTENAWKQNINFDNLDAQDRWTLMEVSGALGSDLTSGIERILRDPNVEVKDEAISSLITQYQSQLSTAAALIDVILRWD